MSIITCANNCDYQKDGYCNLQKASIITNSNGGCPYFVKKTKIAKLKQNQTKPKKSNEING